MFDSRRVGAAALLSLPAGLFAFFAFNSGGFYPGPTAYAAMVLCVVAIARVLLASGPLNGFSLWTSVGAGALALMALLALLSGTWSHEPGVALIEFDLPLVYVLAMLICGSFVHSAARMAWMLRALAVAIIIICACGLITRVLPNVWPIASDSYRDRLAFPVTYWNILGLVAVMGIILCVHFTSDRREPWVTRVVAAGAVPLLAVTLYYTLSRGAIAVAVITLTIYLLVARPILLPSMLLAVVPATAVAVRFAYDANLLTTSNPTTRAAVAQGHHVASRLAICIAVALVLRGALLLLDRKLARIRPPRGIVRRMNLSVWGGSALVLIVLIAVFHGPISRDYNRFVHGSTPGNNSDLRSRLTDPSSNGRVELWRVGWRGFQNRPVLGNGSGTFVNLYNSKRPDTDSVQDAHSLYVETLDELGIVGFVLLMVSIVTVLVRVALRARGPNRGLYAALFCVLIAWALHAGVDWDWEMPVVSVIFFALGGMALARDGTAAAEPARTHSATRIQLALACGLLGVAPAYVWLSEQPLERARTAFADGNCRKATQNALDSISILGIRAEPYEILAYCDVRQGLPQLAITQTQKAISLDPQNWKYTYSLALMRASAGLDPHAAAKHAVQLNPKEMLTQDAWQLLRGGNPAQWEAIGRQLVYQFTTL